MISPPLPPFPRTLPAQLNPVHFNLNIIITIVIIVTTIVVIIVIIILIAIVIVIISPVDDVHRWKGGQEILLDLLLPPRLRPLTIVQIMMVMVMVMVMVLVMVVVNDHGMSTCCYPEGSSPTENSLQRCSCLSELISFIVLIIIFTTCIIIFIMIFIIVIIIMITTFRMIISSSALMALEDFFRSCAEFGLLVGTAARALSPFFAKSKELFLEKILLANEQILLTILKKHFLANVMITSEGR